MEHMIVTSAVGSVFELGDVVGDSAHPRKYNYYYDHY